MKKKLLWVGDAGVPSGFAIASHHILEVLRYEYDVTVMALNYRGDPHDYPYPIYAAGAEGDAFGVRRIAWMCAKVMPDVVVIQNDGWNIPFYTNELKRKNPDGTFKFPEIAAIPVMAVLAVDGKNFQGRWLADVDFAVFWTAFALQEARFGGYEGPASVIPLGVDLNVFYPMPAGSARRRHLPEFMDEKQRHLSQDVFIVGNVNRNQPRKRWDLTIKYLAEWMHASKVENAWLYLHVAPTGDTGVDVRQLARYYGIHNRLALMEPQMFYGISEDEMRDTYNCFDVAISTTQGEGFGLTALEAMACGVPPILPDWAALGEWAKDGAWLVPCTSTEIGSPYVNVIGGVVDEKQFKMALNRLYQDQDARKQNARAALEVAQQPRFRWEQIGQLYMKALETVLAPKEVTA